MPFALNVVGDEPFIYSSDFLHEVTNESCKHDIGKNAESDELAEPDKWGIANGERFDRL